MMEMQFNFVTFYFIHFLIRNFKSKLVKYLNKNIVVKKYVVNDKEFDVYKYVKNELSKHNLKIQPYALTQFINRANVNMDNLNNELQKLIYYSYNLDEIDSETVFQIVTREIEDNIFDLVNALLLEDKEKVFKVYYDLLDHNIKATQILSVVASKFLEILYTKSLITPFFRQWFLPGRSISRRHVGKEFLNRTFSFHIFKSYSLNHFISEPGIIKFPFYS